MSWLRWAYLIQGLIGVGGGILLANMHASDLSTIVAFLAGIAGFAMFARRSHDDKEPNP